MDDSKWDCVRAKDKGCTLYPRCLDCPLDHCQQDGREWRNSKECKLAYVAFTMNKPSYVVASELGISLNYVNQLRRSVRETSANVSGQRDAHDVGRASQDQE